MKKLLSLILALLMCTLALVACSDTEPKTDERPNVQIDSGEGGSNLAYVSNGDGTCYIYGVGNAEITDTVVIPETLSNGERVTAVGPRAFSGCTALASITIPASVTAIGYEAFKGTAYYTNEANWNGEVLYLQNYLIAAKDTLSGNYNIPSGVVCIAEFAFEGCEGLTSVSFPASVKYVGKYAFDECKELSSVSIAKDSALESIGEYAFQYCAELQSITFGDTAEEWKAITKGTEWNLSTGAYVVYCSDEQVTK